MQSFKIIAELANSHNGDVKTIFKTVKTFSKINYSNLDFKFQIISSKYLATPDYPWFNVYKKLEIKKNDWKKIIDYTHLLRKKIWLDIFDDYGLLVLKENFKKIYGIKIQSSVLQNYILLDKLSFLKESEKKIIVNFSGFDFKETNNLLNNKLIFKKKQNLILQFGFQSYPTLKKDLNLEKLFRSKELFPKLNFSFADHLSYKDSFSKSLPIYLKMKNIDCLEKHICLDRKKAKYDYHSALEFNEFNELVNNLLSLNMIKKFSLKNKEEKKYLNSSVQSIVFNKNLYEGNQLTNSDLSFKRNPKKKSNSDLERLDLDNFVLKKNVKKDQVFSKKILRKKRIGIIIAGRLKSTRLPNKALLKINGKESVVRCLESCLKVKEADEVVLATSYLKQDKPLKKFSLKNRVKVFCGHPEDVIQRYLEISKKLKIDVIIRGTADCPYISNEIVSILLKSHFKNKSDFSYAINPAVGTSVEIYNTDTLKKIKKIKKNTSFSEYMTWYVMNNKNFFKITAVKLPKEYSRKYRICLDYKEDLLMLNKLFKKLKEKNLKITLNNIFLILDKYKSISFLNKNCSLVYKTDKKLINFLNKKTRF